MSKLLHVTTVHHDGPVKPRSVRNHAAHPLGEPAPGPGGHHSAGLDNRAAAPSSTPLAVSDAAPPGQVEPEGRIITLILHGWGSHIGIFE